VRVLIYRDQQFRSQRSRSDDGQTAVDPSGLWWPLFGRPSFERLHVAPHFIVAR